MGTGIRYYTRYQARLQEGKEKAGLGLPPATSSLEREEFTEKYFADAQQKVRCIAWMTQHTNPHLQPR